MKYALSEGCLEKPANQLEIDRLSVNLGRRLPDDFLEFLATHNGGEGFVGDNYVILWKAEDLIQFNREYQVDKYAPGIFLFGSSGGGEAYGYDMKSSSPSIVSIPFIGMDNALAEPIANDFQSFFLKLADRDDQ